MHPSTAASEDKLSRRHHRRRRIHYQFRRVAGALNLSRPHQFYAGRGGGIGQGVAGAIGIQIAHPDKPVVCFSGTVQQCTPSKLCGQLRIINSRSFVIWQTANTEYPSTTSIYIGQDSSASNNPYPHMDLEGPIIDFVALAQGHGVHVDALTT